MEPKRRLKEDRSSLVYIVLSVVTCYIYQLYTVYKVSQDVNTACEYDGKKTGGLLKYIGFGIITCSIYILYWHYALFDRIVHAQEKYGFKVNTIAGLHPGVSGC